MNTIEAEEQDIKLDEEEGAEADKEGEESKVEEKKPVESDGDRLARYERQTKQLRKKLGVSEEGKKTKKSENSTELGYGEKAFLMASGLKDQDQMDLALQASLDSGKSLDQVINAPWFKADLEALATKNAIPSGKNRSGNPTATDTVDYWLAKGELPPPEQTKLRRDVVNAKIAKEKTGDVFSKNPVVQ